jgi:hypothetical protein
MTSVQSLAVNNNGEVFVIALVFTNEKKQITVKESGKRVPGYKIILTKYSTNGNESKIDLGLNGQYLFKSSLTTDKDRNCYVLITTGEEDFGTDAIHLLKVNSEDSKVVFNTSYAITQQLSEKIDITQNDKPKTDKPSFYSWTDIKNFRIVEDGSVYITMEKNWSERDESRIGMFSCGVLALKFDATGKIKWSNYIPKKQFYYGTNAYLSHKAMFFNNDMYILYNDDPENETYDIVNSTKTPEKFNGKKNVNLMIVKFEDSGKMTNKVLGKTAQWNTNVILSDCKQISADELLMVGETSNAFGGNAKTKMGIMKFEEAK